MDACSTVDLFFPLYSNHPIVYDTNLSLCLRFIIHAFLYIELAHHSRRGYLISCTTVKNWFRSMTVTGSKAAPGTTDHHCDK
jgi:hypothetical protein